MKLKQALESRVLVGDGANGTLLQSFGFSEYPYDYANVRAPELVQKVHESYFDAGADFVETNTFQASRIRLGPAAPIRDINIRGAQIARHVAGEERLVVGAIGPCGKQLFPIGHITPAELKASVQEQVLALEEGGVDGLLLETFIHMEELRLTVEAIREVSQLPMIVSKAFIEDGDMLARGIPMDFAAEMNELGVLAVGANCIVGPQRMLDIVRMISESSELPILAMPTPGMPQLLKGQVVYDTSPEYFARATARLIDEGAILLGGCCGTHPEHIRQLKDTVGTGKRKAKSGAARRKADIANPELKCSEPSELSQKIGKKFVVAVEMDVPRGLNLEGLLASARALKISGADVINISDGARARLRVNPVAVSDLIQSKIGIEVTMHFSCRDRNLLAIQADILGCHALGIRNILAVTGDPAIIGDYPSATSVFDIDAVGLIRILERFNRGVDMAGYSVGQKCAFTIACAYNPAATDQEEEDERLAQKISAGAQLVYTQPIFDADKLKITADKCHKLNVAMLVGLLPIRNQRHCEFMHNEVPGIEIPDWFRAKIAEAESDQEALQIGIEEAQKLARLAKVCGQGLYLMPPAGNHEAAEAVISAVR